MLHYLVGAGSVQFEGCEIAAPSLEDLRAWAVSSSAAAIEARALACKEVVAQAHKRFLEEALAAAADELGEGPASSRRCKPFPKARPDKALPQLRDDLRARCVFPARLPGRPACRRGAAGW